MGRKKKVTPPVDPPRVVGAHWARFDAPACIDTSIPLVVAAPGSHGPQWEQTVAKMREQLARGSGCAGQICLLKLCPLIEDAEHRYEKCIWRKTKPVPGKMRWATE